MIIFYLFLFILLLLFYLQTNTLIEQYTNQPNIIILIGDSILENKNYSNKSLVEHIEQITNEDDMIICMAEDNNTIQNVIDYQLSELNVNNSRNTYIFVSAGGNDILQKIVYRSRTDPTTLDNIMKEYDNLVKIITNMMNQSNIILLTLYYPPSAFYRKFDSFIREWNINIKNCAKKYDCRVLDLSEFMTTSKDFSHSIEPSDIGGKKMADNMMKMMN